MTEFQEKLRQQHEESMHRELEMLVQTAGPGQAEVSGPTRNTEFGGGGGGGGFRGVVTICCC